MTLYLTALSYLLVGTSVYRLYEYFKVIGKITTAGEVFNSTVLMAVLALLIGVGLILKKSWGRLAAMGFLLLGTIAPLAGGIYVALHYREYAFALVVLLSFMQSFPTFLNNIYSYIVLGIVAAAFSSVFFYIGLQQLRSQRAKDYYDDQPWFGRELTLQGHDLRPVLMALIILFIASLDKLTSQKFQRVAAQKQAAQSVQDLKVELEKDPEYIRQQQALLAAQMKEQADKQRAEYIEFTVDDAKIWIVTADQRVHLIDLYTYKNQSFAFGAFAGRVNDLAPDGKFFYNQEKKMFVQTSNQLEVPLPNDSSIVLGFAAPSSQVLLLQRNSKQLMLWDLVTKKILWTKSWEDNFRQPFLNGVFWSADRKTVLLAPSGAFFLLNVANGEYKKVDFQFRYPEFRASNAETHQFVVSGPVAFNQNNYKTYLINSLTGSWTEAATSEAIVGFDPIEKIYIAKWGQEVKFLPMEVPNSISKKIAITYNAPFLKSTGRPWALTYENLNTRVNFLNLKTDQKVPMGQTFSVDRPLEDRVTKMTVTASGSLWVISNRNKFEVFWSSELAKASPRSWPFELHIGP